jgi:hypothetical protein
VGLGVGQILAEMAKLERSVIRRTPKGDAFQFTDTRFAMAIRVMLKKTDQEKVIRIEL